MSKILTEGITIADLEARIAEIKKLGYDPKTTHVATLLGGMEYPITKAKLRPEYHNSLILT